MLKIASTKSSIPDFPLFFVQLGRYQTLARFFKRHTEVEIPKVFRLSSQYSVTQLPFIFGIAKIKNITIACLIITNHFRHGLENKRKVKRKNFAELN